jgi:hypothetical protein
MASQRAQAALAQGTVPHTRAGDARCAGGAPKRAGFPFGTDAAELLRAEGLS